MKKCTKCNTIKKINQFHRSAGFADKHNNWCKRCMSDYHKIYRLNSNVRKMELINGRKYQETHRENVRERSNIWKLNNRVKVRNYRRKYNRMKRKTDINFRLTASLRSRVRLALKGNPKTSTTMNLVGCSLFQLKHHLERKFKPGMNWSNWGTGRNGKSLQEWHIDHIKPCASFDLSKPEEQRKCFHYTNLQPLWAEENCSKQNN